MPDAQTLTLTDFLLARIAEDEAVARSIDLDPAHVFRQAGGSRLRWLMLAGDRPWLDGRARVLAECEARRRIVEAANRWTDDIRVDIALDEVLGLLALPYVDHPDYRQEFRP